MMCALSLAKRTGRRILIIERNDRLGKKLSATGNGQGNISNTFMDSSHYFTTEESKVRDIINRYDDKCLLSDLEELGGMFKADEFGRIYPFSMQASSVTDLIRYGLSRHKNIDIIYSAQVLEAFREGNKFRVRTKSEIYYGDRLVLSAGGKAAKHFGTDGSAYALAEAFGHSVTALSPALVQMKTPLDYIRGMKGIRCDCLVTLYENKKLLKSVRGDLIFTDYGVSGNAVFKLSSFLTDNNRLEINFLPEISEEKLTEALNKKVAAYPELPVSQLLYTIVNHSVARSLIKYCKINGEAPCGSDPQYVSSIVSALRAFELKVTGTLGFDYAQVTRGGIPTEETTCCLMSKKCPNLYFTGEILNVDGECGGYNLQWAFSSAVCVAEAIAKDLYENR